MKNYRPAISNLVDHAVIAWLFLMTALLGLTQAAFAQQGLPPVGSRPLGRVPSGAAFGKLTGSPVTAPPAAADDRLRAFSGDWKNMDIVFGPVAVSPAPLRPEFAAKLGDLVQKAKFGEEIAGNDSKCIPNGPVMDMNLDMRVFVDSQQMGIIAEINGFRLRYVFLDRKTHTPDNLLFASSEGESIGHWEGSTLVVDTIGLDPANEIIYGLSVNDPKMHVVERWRMVSSTTLDIQTTIESPAGLTQPWSYHRTYVRKPLVRDIQYCTSATDRDKGGQYDLTPPTGGYVPPGVGK